MSKFKDMVARDNARTFMNLDEFAEKRIVVYDGVTYDGEDHAGIPVVLSGLKEKDRRQLMSDHIQGLFLVSSVLHCRIQDLGGNQPEKGRAWRSAIPMTLPSSDASTSPRRSASWACFAWNWRRSTNEQVFQSVLQPVLG